jgi:hypothetical protein
MKYMGLKAGLYILCIGASIGCASYFSNIINGTFQGIFWGTLLYLVLLLIITIIERHGISLHKAIILYCTSIILYILVIIAWHWYYLAPPSSILFERVLYMPKPQSTAELISAVEYPGKDIHFRLRFTTDSAGLAMILKKFSRTRRSQYKSYAESPNRIYDSLDAFYLKSCMTYPWWDMEKLLDLPVYTWDDDRYWRNMWFERVEGGKLFRVYISGIGD